MLLLKRTLPTVEFQRGKIWEAFVRWSDLDENTAIDALTLGTPPEIKVEYLIDSFGSYKAPFLRRRKRRKLDDIIFLDREMLDWYDHCPANASDADLELYIVKTTLHEMCHWGDWRDREHLGGRGPDGELFEEGEMFQREAFPNVLLKSVWQTNREAYLRSLGLTP